MEKNCRTKRERPVVGPRRATGDLNELFHKKSCRRPINLVSPRPGKKTDTGVGKKDPGTRKGRVST